MLVAFAEAYPEVRLKITASSRHVDLIAEGYDAALRAGQLTGPSLVSRRLNSHETQAYASPA